MGEWGREYRTSEELLEDVNSSLGETNDLLVNIVDLLIEGVQKEEATATSAGSGEGGNLAKVFTKFTKTLKMAPALFVLEQLMKLIEPLMILLEPIAIIFDILSGLFSVLAGEILKSLVESLQPLFTMLISLMPVFAEIGKIIGELIATILKPLMGIFEALSPIISVIMKIIVELLKVALIPLKIIFEVIGAILEPFLPILKKLSPIFELLGNILAWVIRIGMLPLIAAVYGIGIAIAALINFFTFGLVDAVGAWNGLMLPIMASLVGLAEGGVVTKPTLALIGEGREPEMVTPLSKAKQMGFGGGSDEQLMGVNEKLETLIQIQKRQTRGLQRRRFG